MPITNLAFKAILKELVSSTNRNRKTFHPQLQSALKNITQPSMSDATPAVMPVMTVVTSTSSPQTTSQPTPYTISSEGTSHLVNQGRGLP